MELWGFEKGFSNVGEKQGMLQQAPVRLPPLPTPTQFPNASKPPVTQNPAQHPLVLRGTLPALPAISYQSRVVVLSAGSANQLGNIGITLSTTGRTAGTQVSVTLGSNVFASRATVPQVAQVLTGIHPTVVPAHTTQAAANDNASIQQLSIAARSGIPEALMTLVSRVRGQTPESVGRATYSEAVGTIAHIARQPVSVANPEMVRVALETIRSMSNGATANILPLHFFLTATDTTSLPLTESHVHLLGELTKSSHISVAKLALEGLHQVITSATSTRETKALAFNHLVSATQSTGGNPATIKAAIQILARVANTSHPLAPEALHVLMSLMATGNKEAQQVLTLNLQNLPVQVSTEELAPNHPAPSLQIVNALAEIGNPAAKMVVAQLVKNISAMIPETGKVAISHEAIFTLILGATRFTGSNSADAMIRNLSQVALNRIYDRSTRTSASFKKDLKSRFLPETNYGFSNGRRSATLDLLIAYWEKLQKKETARAA